MRAPRLQARVVGLERTGPLHDRVSAASDDDRVAIVHVGPDPITLGADSGQGQEGVGRRQMTPKVARFARHRRRCLAQRGQLGTDLGRDRRFCLRELDRVTLKLGRGVALDLLQAAAARPVGWHARVDRYFEK